jgi:hypothetical protein
VTDGSPPTPPGLRREAAGRYWIGDYEIVRTGPSRWTLGLVDPDHVRTFGGGRDRGYALIDNYPTLADAVEGARVEWMHERHPDTMAARDASKSTAPMSKRLA